MKLSEYLFCDAGGTPREKLNVAMATAANQIVGPQASRQFAARHVGNVAQTQAGADGPWSPRT